MKLESLCLMTDSKIAARVKLMPKKQQQQQQQKQQTKRQKQKSRS